MFFPGIVLELDGPNERYNGRSAAATAGELMRETIVDVTVMGHVCPDHESRQR